MSYIIAFVSGITSSKSFPVNCFRIDLKVGDHVIVRLFNRQLIYAEITGLRYLNWDCKGRIECKVSETSIGPEGRVILPPGLPIHVGVATSISLINELRLIGWVPIKKRQKMYSSVLANVNSSSNAYIFIRKNGIDIQVLPSPNPIIPKPYSLYEGSFTQGQVVRHSLPHTTFNLFYGILRFSDSFLNNEKNLDRYFVPQGSTDKRTDELKNKAFKCRSQNNEIMEAYDDCFDDGPVYLSDGMWLTSDGCTHDWGR